MFNYTPREELEAQGKIVLSPTRLMALRKSPQSYKSKYILKEQETTDAMRIGTLIHKAILEAETFHDEYKVLEPKENFICTIDELKKEIERLGSVPVKGKKEKLIEQLLMLDEGAKIWEIYEEKMLTSGKTLVSAEMFKRCERVIEEIKKHKWLNQAIVGGQKEVKLTWKYDEQIYLNMILDYINPAMGMNKTPVMIDVKTTTDASPRACRRAIEQHGLLIQAATNVDAGRDLLGVEPLYAWAFVEHKPPYHVTVVSADFGMIEIGRKLYKGLIDVYKSCSAKNEWPGYDSGQVIAVGVSDWYLNEIEDTYPEDEVYG